MQKIKKILAVTVLLMALPMLAFVASRFVLGSSKDIYNYIPETSYIVIEVNTRNFVREIMYQRIFQEDYFNETIVIEDGEELEIPPGIDPFSSVVVFREQWAEEVIWMALVGYTSREDFEPYLAEQLPGSQYEFGRKYVLVQMTPSIQQENIDEHMTKIMNGEIKSFKQRVDLTELFDPSKEINCYAIPQSGSDRNQLLNGNLSFDFLGDHIKVYGEFTPVSGFGDNSPVAYAVNKDAAISLRSSLNLVHNIYWANSEVVEDIPDYSQMALDYDAMKMFMIHKNLGYPFYMKFFPEMQIHFDIVGYKNWQNFLDTLKAADAIKMDTVSHTFVENQVGVFFQYTFDEQKFELMRKEVTLTPSDDNRLYFALHVNVKPLMDNVTFLVDEENPPALAEQGLGLVVAEMMVDEIRVMSNIENVDFELRLEDETNLVADGRIQMVNRNGNSIIESMDFGKAAVSFFKTYLSGTGSAAE